MAKSKKKYYAVRVGENPGIYTEWSGPNGAQKQTNGYPGAIFKSFATKKEAADFMKEKTPEQNGGDEPDTKALPKDAIIIYTDGACIKNPGPGGYGVIIRNRKKSKELSGGYKRTTNNPLLTIAYPYDNSPCRSAM